MTEIKNDAPLISGTTAEQVSARRRFLGKSVAKAAPFVITLASQPALGATCFTPSRSLSKNTSLSQKDFIGECRGAQSPGNYKAQQTSGPSYSWPAGVPPSTLMHPLFSMGNSEGVTKFTKTVSGKVVSQTLGEALNVEASGQVHFHIIGAYLNIMGGNGAVISDKAMTASRLMGMWSEYVTKGYFEPTAGVKWYAAEIVSYLKVNGIVA